MHVADLRDGESVQFFWKIDNRQFKTTNANIIELSQRDSGEAERENRRQHRRAETQELATTPGTDIVSLLHLHRRAVRNNFVSDQNRDQRDTNQR